MRSGAAAGHEGFFHEGAFYDSDEEFLALVVPFLTEGIDAGEPVLVAFPEPKVAMLRAALPDASAVTFLVGDAQYNRPASTIRNFRQLFGDLVAAGAPQIRVTGEVPHPGLGSPWSGWARYEAAVNYTLAEFPVWALCPYDTRITPDHVLADIVRTHPHLVTPGGERTANSEYLEPSEFLGSRISPETDPLEVSDPVLELADPSPAIARRAVQAVVLAGGMLRNEADDLITAVHEAVANALIHGRGPVRLRVWTGVQRAVVAVTDRGAGPADPFAGLVPAQHSPHGGLGLWLTHQLCRHVTMSRDEQGFTIRLVAGRA